MGSLDNAVRFSWELCVAIKGHQIEKTVANGHRHWHLRFGIKKIQEQKFKEQSITPPTSIQHKTMMCHCYRLAKFDVKHACHKTLAKIQSLESYLQVWQLQQSNPNCCGNSDNTSRI